VLDRLDALLVSGVLLLTLGGCQPRQPARVSRPTEAQVASVLPKGAEIDEIAYADLNGDGRDEVLVAATLPFPGSRLRTGTAVVLALDSHGQYTPAIAHSVGEGWLPIQVARPAEHAPVAAVFATQSGSGAYLDFLVVQHEGLLQVTLEGSGILKGSIRFVPDGLLVTSGDVDWIYRWASHGWQREDLDSQYLPQLPPGTIVVPYMVDPARGARVLGPRFIRARVGQSLFLRRMNPGEPSRLALVGGVFSDSAVWRPDGSISLLKPDRFDIAIDSPAYSDRILRITVQVDP
jgi:hypothetical protein